MPLQIPLTASLCFKPHVYSASSLICYLVFLLSLAFSGCNSTWADFLSRVAFSWKVSPVLFILRRPAVPVAHSSPSLLHPCPSSSRSSPPQSFLLPPPLFHILPLSSTTLSHPNSQLHSIIEHWHHTWAHLTGSRGWGGRPEAAIPRTETSAAKGVHLKVPHTFRVYKFKGVQRNSILRNLYFVICSSQ